MAAFDPKRTFPVSQHKTRRVTAAMAAYFFDRCLQLEAFATPI
jgi:hypothetical protein